MMRGQLDVDTHSSSDKEQALLQVVVSNFNFVESNHPTSFHTKDDIVLNEIYHESPSTSGERNGKDPTTKEEIWRKFFANPLQWWDYRAKKRNPKSPDFKHKDTGEVLWIESKLTPTWVKPQLALLDNETSSQVSGGKKAGKDDVTSEKNWKAFFTNPLEW